MSKLINQRKPREQNIVLKRGMQTKTQKFSEFEMQQTNKREEKTKVALHKKNPVKQILNISHETSITQKRKHKKNKKNKVDSPLKPEYGQPEIIKENKLMSEEINEKKRQA